MTRIVKKIRGKPSQEILDKLSEEGLSPVEVMVLSMRRLHRKADLLIDQIDFTPDDKRASIVKEADDTLLQACEIAKDVAPYFHARLQSVTVGGDPESPIAIELTDVAELRKLLRGTGTTTPVATKPPNK